MRLSDDLRTESIDSANKAQTEAINGKERFILVLAGPGSGKTYTITKRLIRLINDGVAPENILVVTFTKDAAVSMQQRFNSTTDEFYPVNFGTFHSIFYFILKESHVLDAYTLISEKQKIDIITELLSLNIPSVKEENNSSLKDISINFIKAIGYYKNTLSDIAASKLLNQDYSQYFKLIYSKYEEYRLRYKYFDFDDMLLMCLELFENNIEQRKLWQDRFKYILIDEFQDINPIQMRIIELLIGDATNLFCVGDDDQSIYGFRGSNPRCIKEFKDKYKPKQYVLGINYRCRPEIVEASLKVISDNKERVKKDLKAFKASASTDKNQSELKTFTLKGFENADKQYEEIVNIVNKVSKDSSVGILFRTNLSMQACASYLTKSGVSYEMKEQIKSVYNHPVIKDIMSYLKIAYKVGTKQDYIRVINKPNRYINREAISQGKTDVLFEAQTYYLKRPAVPFSKERIEAIRSLRQDLDMVKRVSLFLGIKHILRKIGYERYIKEVTFSDPDKLEEYMSVIDFLCDDIKKYDTLEEYIRAQELYEEELKNKKDTNTKKSYIHLMTVHASKGLEFQHTIIPDCNERIYPHGKMPDLETVEEERRIFYVAMTRAMETLHLFYQTGTEERPKLKSRFLRRLT